MDTQKDEKIKQKKPFYKQWWFYLIIVIAIISILTAIFGSASTENGEQPDNQEVGGDVSSEHNYYIGENAVVGEMEYTVKQVVDTTVFVIGDEIVTTENNFIKITLTIKNLGNTAIRIYSSNIKLYRDKAEYYTKYESKDLSLYELAPGLSKEFILIFEVPDKSTEYDYILQVKESKTVGNIILKEVPPKE